MAAASTAVRPIGHEDRLSLVEHLDELRTRLIVCVVTLVVAFAICAWQNKALLDFIGKPLATQTEQRTEDGKGPLGGIYTADKGARAALQTNVVLLAGARRTTRARRRGSRARSRCSRRRSPRRRCAQLPKAPPPNQPVTLGIGEPFTQTLTIAAYFALLFALPDHPLPALRVRAAGVQPRASGQVALAADVDGPGPVRGRGRLRLLRRPARGDEVPAELQRGPVQRPRPGAATTTSSPSSRSCRCGVVFQLPVGILAAHARSESSACSSCAGIPPLRDRRDRRRWRWSLPGTRPGLDALRVRRSSTRCTSSSCRDGARSRRARGPRGEAGRRRTTTGRRGRSTLT